ncbi:hypothetical protein ACSSS7_007828 [Eimeria intestinalis]
MSRPPLPLLLQLLLQLLLLHQHLLLFVAVEALPPAAEADAQVLEAPPPLDPVAQRRAASSFAARESLQQLVREGAVSPAFAASPYVQQRLLPMLKEQPLLLLSRGSMMAGYPTVEEANLLMHALAYTYGPTLIERHVIGHSVEGRPILAYRVGGILRQQHLKEQQQQQQPQQEQQEEQQEFPAVLLTGLHHSREPLSMAVCLFMTGE